jgi:hypothetical protein
MKTYKMIAFLLVLNILIAEAQQIEKLNYGLNTLKGKIILKTLIHPLNETEIKNCMVLKLNQKVMFIGNSEFGEGEAITDEIRIYGVQNSTSNNATTNNKYKSLINKQVIVKATVYYAPSGYYPLLANINEFISYKVMSD